MKEPRHDWPAPDPNERLTRRLRWGPILTYTLWIAALVVFLLDDDRDVVGLIVTLFVAFLAGGLLNHFQKKDER